MESFSEIDGVMMFLTKNGFIAGANNPPGYFATRVMHEVCFESSGMLMTWIDWFEYYTRNDSVCLWGNSSH